MTTAAAPRFRVVPGPHMLTAKQQTILALRLAKVTYKQIGEHVGLPAMRVAIELSIICHAIGAENEREALEIYEEWRNA